MTHKICSSLWAIGLAALLFSSPSAAQISLGTAENFGVLGGSTVTNTGGSQITGNLGLSPGSSVTGFPPGVVVPPGTIHIADAIAVQAQVDTTTAYNALAATPTLTDLTGTDLGGLVLTPSVYGFATSAQLTGTLTLDALGDPDAVFIFKIASTLTTADGSAVVVINGGSPCNVYWQIGSSATLGSGTAFAGNLLAFTSITLATGASVSGRTLARNGAVTLDTNSVAICPLGPGPCPTITISPATLPPGSVGTPYNQIVVAAGSTALPFTYAISSGSLPPGLSLDPASGAISGTPNRPGTSNFTVTATDANGCPGSRPYSIVIAAQGCPPIVLSPPTLPDGELGQPYSEFISASGGLAPYAYSVSSGSLPTGLMLDGATGEISGIPTEAGTFNFTITATDAEACLGTASYAVIVGGSVTDIPTLSQWGQLLMVALCAMAAIVLLRRSAA